MNIAIIDYGYGNLHSVAKAFEKANTDFNLNSKIEVTKNPSKIKNADKIVLPGVGSFLNCSNAIKEIDGVYDAMQENILHKKNKFMGICVGMQLLADIGYENQECNGFGWLSGSVEKIEASPEYKIPHMGWNEVNAIESPLFKGILNNSDFYFIHSYHFKTTKENIVASTMYSSEITAAVQKDNIFGTQFHPEKSHNNGQLLIKNFIDW